MSMADLYKLDKKNRHRNRGDSLNYLEQELEYYDDDIDHRDILRHCRQWVDEHGGHSTNINLHNNQIREGETFENEPVNSKGSYASYTSLMNAIQSGESCDNKSLSEEELTVRNSFACDICNPAIDDNNFLKSMDRVKGAISSICGKENAHLDVDINEISCEATIVRVTVRTAMIDFGTGENEWDLPLSLVIKRENEMREIAQRLGLLWNGSVIMNEVQKYFYKVRKAESQVGSTVFSSTVEGQNNKDLLKESWYCFSDEVSVILDLDIELAKVAPIDALEWSQKLFDTILRFYNTGIIHISEQCTCHDTFLLLNCLGVLYNKEQLKFENFSTYLRYKSWSTYREYREDVVSWIKIEIEVQKMKRAGQRIAFVSSPSKDGTMYKIGNMECRVLEMERSPDADVPPHAVVHSFFNEEYIEKDPTSREYTRQIRTNFASYLQHHLPFTSVSFAPRQVMIWKKETSIRVASVLPVLLIERNANITRRHFQQNTGLINELLSGSEGFPFSTLSCSSCNINLGDGDYGTYSTEATTETSSSMILSHSSEEVYTMTSTYTGSSLTEQASKWIGESLSHSYSDSVVSTKGKRYLKMDDLNAKWLLSVFVGGQ